MTVNCILIVDDCAPLRIGMRDILEGEGYRVLTANDGVHALEILSNSARDTFPNLILSDVAMPRMDGYALCQAIHARAGWASTPVIFVTAKKDKVLDECAADLITKPFDPEALVTLMARHLQASRAT